jgi:phosphoribosyl 1,2-cyclic phosphate phosphodiesterase
MELHHLGTAAAEGWPAMFCRCESCKRARALGGRNIRTRHSALLDGRIKFDFNADTYLHMLRDGIDLTAVETILMTHSHHDHLWAGDLINRFEWYALPLEQPLRIYGNDRVLSIIRGAFPDYSKAGIELHLARPFAPFEAGDATVIPLRAAHDPLETCLNYLVTRGGKTLLYLHDSGWWPEDTWAFLGSWAVMGGRIDLASLDCTNGPADNGKGHMGIPVLQRLRDRLLQLGAFTPETVSVVSHFTHWINLTHAELEGLANPLGFQVAYDGMKVQV